MYLTSNGIASATSLFSATRSEVITNNCPWRKKMSAEYVVPVHLHAATGIGIVNTNVTA